MTRYTFTDDSGNAESHEFVSDDAATAALRQWAEQGEYDGPQEMCAWDDERVVYKFIYWPRAAPDPDDGQPDEAQEWASFDPDC